MENKACTIQQFNGVDVLLERINEILQPNRNITKVRYLIRTIILNIYNIYMSKLIKKLSNNLNWPLNGLK